MGIQKLIVFGTGQIAEVAANYIKEDKNVELIAFTVEKKFLKQKTFLNYPVVPFEDLIKTYNPKENLLFAPLSYKNMNSHRIRIFKKGKALGYKFYSFIHKNCVNYSKSIGENCFILENNFIQPFCVIEDNCIIWSGNHIGHHSNILSHTFISSHVVISGSVNVGQGSFLGVNSTIIDNINIGEFSLIGAGCIITRNTGKNSLFVGEASRPHKKLTSLEIKF